MTNSWHLKNSENAEIAARYGEVLWINSHQEEKAEKVLDYRP